MTEDNVIFPPYGAMPLEFISPDETWTPPATWSGHITYERWIAKAASLISDRLWPIYDPASGTWRGAAAANMHAVTAADFALFPSLRAKFEKAAGEGVDQLHARLFTIEDLGDVAAEESPDFVPAPQPDPLLPPLVDNSVDRTLRIYLQAINENPEPLAAEYIQRMGSVCGALPLHLKHHLQRPRPLQMGLMLGMSFTYQLATSAASPAMISGHCYQGMVGGIASFYKANELNAPAAVLRMLARHTVDVGDRRVFAGVHYPSDNLSSWIAMFLAAPFIFPDQQGVRWAWKAVVEHSAVYHAIAAGIADGTAGALVPAWDWLHALDAADRDAIVEQLMEATTEPA